MNDAERELRHAQREIAAQGGRHIGDLCSWNIAGVDAPRYATRDIFDREGLPGLIADQALDSALTRAAAEGRKPAGLVVRAFERPNRDTPCAVGLYRVRGRDGESGDDYVCVARVRVAAGSALPLPPEGEVTFSDEDARRFAEDIAKRANHLVGYVQSKDVSKAMTDALHAIGAVPLRDRGGFYLVPPGQCERWRRLSSDLEAIGVERILIEMHDAPSNISAATRAASASLESDLAELQRELQDSIGKQDSDRKRPAALTRRVEECERIRAKAALFRDLLAGKVDELDAQLAQLGGAFKTLLDGGKVEAFDWIVPDAQQGAAPEQSTPAAEVPAAEDDPFSLASAAQ